MCDVTTISLGSAGRVRLARCGTINATRKNASGTNSLRAHGTNNASGVHTVQLRPRLLARLPAATRPRAGTLPRVP